MLARTPPKTPFAEALGSVLFQGLTPAIAGALERVLLLDRLYEVYEKAATGGKEITIFDRLLYCLRVRPEISGRDVERIPRQGPVKGPILGSLLAALRSGHKFMVNALLAAMPEISRHCILVNPFGGPDARRENLRGLRESIGWLKRGGMISVFPAGEVAHMDVKRRSIADPPWSETIARIVRLTGAAVVPVYFDGAHSTLFQARGLLHPNLRTALLPYEFLNKHGATIELRVGDPIPARKIAGFIGRHQQ